MKKSKDLIDDSMSDCHSVIGQSITGVIMFIQINFSSPKPAYLQIVDQIKWAAASGAIRAGEPLPSIRPLSEQLRINRNTVAKAYSELESQGVIETSAGRGCFLKNPGSPLKKEVRHELMVEEIDGVIVQAHHLQISGKDLLRMVGERLEHFEGSNNNHK